MYHNLTAAFSRQNSHTIRLSITNTPITPTAVLSLQRVYFEWLLCVRERILYVTTDDKELYSYSAWVTHWLVGATEVVCYWNFPKQFN